MLAALLLMLAAPTTEIHIVERTTTQEPQATYGQQVLELGVAEAQAGMAGGRFTSRALVAAYKERIAGLDDAGPGLDAVIALSSSAEAEAEARDAERAAGTVRGPLHGVPVLLKDNIDVAGMVTSAGSLALAEHRPGRDAALVTRLREAGAVILGKTNLSEWANFRSPRSTSGWSSLGGLTKNPYVLSHNACGSSSGTGAAIAASFATVGVGTETDGSILCPAAANGLVGLKPTVGQVPQHGLVPISAVQDTAGPMGRTVADVAALYAVLAAKNPVKLDKDALRGRRIGVLRHVSGKHPEVDTLFASALDVLRQQGATLVDPVEISTWDQWNEPELEALLYEFKDGLNRYLAETGAPVRSLSELIAWNTAHADAVMPWFGQELLVEAQARGGLDEAGYRLARETATRLAGPEGLHAALQQNQLDAVVAPATGPAWPSTLGQGDAFGFASWGAAAVAGSPSLTVPMGETGGLPVGLAWMSAPDREDLLLNLGYAYEAASHARRPPGYRAARE